MLAQRRKTKVNGRIILEKNSIQNKVNPKTKGDPRGIKWEIKKKNLFKTKTKTKIKKKPNPKKKPNQTWEEIETPKGIRPNKFTKNKIIKINNKKKTSNPNTDPETNPEKFKKKTLNQLEKKQEKRKK